MKHIDAHIHLYPKKLMDAIYRYFAHLGWHLPLTPDVDGALNHLRQNNMEKGFLLLYAHKTDMSFKLNEWAYELCWNQPQLIPFGSFFPDDSYPEALVKTCLRNWDFAGFKLHFNVQPYHPDDPRYYPVYRGSLEYGKRLVMHIGTFPNKGKHAGVEQLAGALKRFPKLKIMVAHMGLYQTDEFWRLMDKYPGVYLDTAFVLGNPDFSGSDNIITETLKRFPKRVIYGSDFPLICHRLSDGLNYIDSLPWDQQTKENLLYNNAIQFLE